METLEISSSVNAATAFTSHVRKLVRVAVNGAANVILVAREPRRLSSLGFCISTRIIEHNVTMLTTNKLHLDLVVIVVFFYCERAFVVGGRIALSSSSGISSGGRRTLGRSLLVASPASEE